MTTGIYALFWENNNAVYIGQSINIEKRFINHLYRMKNNRHYNYKVQDTYNLYGVPRLIILDIVDLVRLNDYEIYWVKEFDSINKGLNISEPGNNSGFGVSNPNAHYSKLDILRVFRMLYTTTYPIKDIARICGVNKGLPQDIHSQSRHLWLKDLYPYQYSLMLIKKLIRQNSAYKTTRKSTELSSRVSVLPKIVSPDGITYTISNISRFCRLHSLTQSGLSNLINGKIKTHKGWVLHTKLENF